VTGNSQKSLPLHIGGHLLKVEPLSGFVSATFQRVNLDLKLTLRTADIPLDRHGLRTVRNRNCLMPERRRNFCSFTAAALLLAATLPGVTANGSGDVPSCKGGYLSAVGPVPLRFQLPPEPPPTNAPAAHVAAPAAEATNLSPPAPGYLDAAATFDILNPLPAREYYATSSTFPPPVTPPAPVQVPVEASQPEPSVSPEMLLRYFTRQTNGTGMSVIAPIGFNPPAATTPPSSTATFTVGPP
jgi:hypothetical protein